MVIGRENKMHFEMSVISLFWSVRRREGLTERRSRERCTTIPTQMNEVDPTVVVFAGGGGEV